MSEFNMPPGVSTRDIPGQDDPERGLIATECVFPAIPTTMFDWMASIRGEEDGPTGRGLTEAEALRDLCEQLALAYLENMT